MAANNQASKRRSAALPMHVLELAEVGGCMQAKEQEVGGFMQAVNVMRVCRVQHYYSQPLTPYNPTGRSPSSLLVR